MSAVFWSYLVHCFSGDKKGFNRKLIGIYAQSNVGKYLPGNFMQLIGRNVLANNLGYKHSTIIMASIYEIGYVLLAGLLVLFMILLFNLSDISLQKSLLLSPEKLAITVVIVFSIIAFFVFFFKDKIIDYINQNEIIPKLKNTFLLGLGVFIFVYILLAMANLLLLSIFMDGVSSNDYINILFVFILSWIVGFVMPGMPGGIGVREALFIFMLSQKYEIFVVTLIPIIFRLINILGDVCFFALYSIKSKKN